MAVLKGLTISVAGTLKYDTTQIKKWVEANGGTYTPSMRKGLTHLVASKHAWRFASDAVQTAVDLQAWVVCWDWLEDSLQDHRKKAEKPYSWEFLEQQRKRSREIEKLGARADRKKFEDGCVEARRATGSGTSKSKSKPMSKPRPRASTRKKRESLTSYLLNDDLVKDIPFVSAAETLKRKRAEREAAKPTKPTPRAPKPSSSSSSSSSKKAASTTSPSPSAPSPPSHPLTTNAPPPLTQRAKRPSLKDLYHYYLDATGFEYKILLTRCDLHRNTMQRYQLSILESHTKPNVYCTFIQYYPAAAPDPPDVNASGAANNVSGPSNSNSKSDNSATAGELGVMQAVLDFNASYPSTSTATTSSSSSSARSSSSIIPPPYTGPQEHHPEAQRLRALTQDPTDPTTPAAASPPETLPYTALLTPLSTPYPTAHASFRHAFRDLTLLSWCERFSVGKALYKRRAEEYGVEPFVYLRPKGGMPVGAVVQIGVAEGGGNGGEGILCEGAGVLGEGFLGEDEGLGLGEDEGERKVKYPFLPALHAPLGNGVIGSAVAADRREAERREADRRETDGREKASREAEEATHVPNPQRNPENPAKKKRPRYDRPLFNGLLGPPGPPGPPGQPTREREGGGFGTAKRQRKAWPCETGLL